MKLKFILFLIKLLKVDVYKISPTHDMFIQPKHREIINLRSNNQYSSYGMDFYSKKHLEQESIRRSLNNLGEEIYNKNLYSWRKTSQPGPMGERTHSEVEIEILKPINKQNKK